MKPIISACFLIILKSVCVRSDCYGCWDTQFSDYDYTNQFGYDYPEVIYLPPEKINNIIDFLKKISTSTPSTDFIPKQNTEETTKYREEMTTTTETTTTPETTTVPTTSTATTTTSTEATTTVTVATTTLESIKVEVDVEDPVEDIPNNIIIEKEEVEPLKNSNIDLVPPPPPVIVENFDYDDYERERDSQEDLLSSNKKPEQMKEPTTPMTIDDENDSQPKNINTWLRF